MRNSNERTCVFEGPMQNICIFANNTEPHSRNNSNPSANVKKTHVFLKVSCRMCGYLRATVMKCTCFWRPMQNICIFASKTKPHTQHNSHQYAKVVKCTCFWGSQAEYMHICSRISLLLIGLHEKVTQDTHRNVLWEGVRGMVNPPHRRSRDFDRVDGF